MKFGIKYKQLKCLASSILFVAYFLNVVSFESLHQAIHHHAHLELHTEEAESDACHRAIYHAEVSTRCQHDNHISKHADGCDLCDVVLSNSHQSVASSQTLNRSLIIDFQPISITYLIYEIDEYKQSRSPPFQSEDPFS